MKYSNYRILTERKYNPDGYNVGLPLAEKLLFSAPEYFVLETRFGDWIILQLQKALDFLNRKWRVDIRSNNACSKNIIRTSSDYVSRTLGWLNILLEAR